MAVGGGGGRGFGGFGGGGAGGGAVTGTVKLVDGTNVYVTDTSGNVVKVDERPSSQLTKTDPATTKDVAPGDVVIVRGTPNSDGSYTAQTLVISSASRSAADLPRPRNPQQLAENGSGARKSAELLVEFRGWAGNGETG